jgi:hypothetical protein
VPLLPERWTNEITTLALMSPSENCEILANQLGGIAVRGKAENATDLQVLFDTTVKKYGRIDSLLIM